jgi:hypothetical protein
VFLYVFAALFFAAVSLAYFENSLTPYIASLQKRADNFDCNLSSDGCIAKKGLSFRLRHAVQD